MTPTWLTESEMAAYLRIDGKRPVEYLQRLCRRGQILYAKRGRNYFFRKEWGDAFMLKSAHPNIKGRKAA